MNKIRVLVIDDHPLMREAIRAAIEVEPDMAVVGEAADGYSAVKLALTLHPDVTIMDLLLPGQDGLAAVREILRQNPQARILILTSSSDNNRILEAIRVGAAGYLLKDVQRQELLQAIREIERGNGYLPPAIARKLMESIQREQSSLPAPLSPESFTTREQEVLTLLGEGASNREIAAKLNISEGTARVHVHNILGKLGLENRNQVMLYLRGKGVNRHDQ